MNLKNIKPGTLIRSALVIFIFLFLILKDCGVISIPIDAQQLVDSMTAAAAAVTAVVAAWKNNSFTEEAIRADEILDELRGKITTIK